MDLSLLHQVQHLAIEGKWKELEDFFNQSYQLKIVGASIEMADPKRPAVLIREVTSLHRGGIGSDAVNGGIISMLIDLAIGLLGFPYFAEGMTATHHLSIHFAKPLMAESVRFEAEETHVIGNRVFGHVKVMNEKGEVCAFASGVVVKGIKK
ncbi:MAG: PaaI family thioesterase [Cyclobacteriaceae bacterium]|nr:PaaI family thioesterase [Cyclobacteriaceae bacterium]